MKTKNLFGLVFAFSLTLSAAAENFLSSYCKDLNNKSLNPDYQGKLGQLYGCWKNDNKSQYLYRNAMIFDFSSTHNNKNFQMCLITNLSITLPSYYSQSLPSATFNLTSDDWYLLKDPNTLVIRSEEGFEVIYTRDLNGEFIQSMYDDPSKKCLEIEAFP